jgi:hypothetical protein
MSEQSREAIPHPAEAGRPLARYRMSTELSEAGIRAGVQLVPYVRQDDGDRQSLPQPGGHAPALTQRRTPLNGISPCPPAPATATDLCSRVRAQEIGRAEVPAQRELIAVRAGSMTGTGSLRVVMGVHPRMPGERYRLDRPAASGPTGLLEVKGPEPLTAGFTKTTFLQAEVAFHFMELV